MGDQPATGKKSKRFKWPIRIAIAFLIYTVVGFFVVPAIIKSQMLKRLPALTKRQVAVEQVKCNPYVLSLTIRGFSLKETNGDSFVKFDEFYGNFQLWASLFHRSWVFDEISLKEPSAQITYQADGTFNFANLLNNVPAQPKPTNAAPQALPSVTIYNLSITNGALSFADLDRKVPFNKVFTPIDVNLTNLTTIRDQNSPYMILARTGDGETFAWSGGVTINPLRSDGEFRLGALKLAQFGTYSHDYAKCDITNGLLDIAADYRYDSATNALDLSVSNAAVHLTHFELKVPDTGEIVLAIPTLSVTGIEASVARMTARVGLVKSSGGSVLVRQNQDGAINLLSMLNLPKADPEKAAKPSELPPLSAKIDEIAFDDYTIKAEDRKPAKPATFNIDHLSFDVKGVSNASNAPVTASVALRFQEIGTIGVEGTLTLMPLSADLQLAMTNVDLRAVQPYVEQQIKLAVTSGGVDLHGRARYSATPEPGAPLINFTGDLAINKFATVDDVLFKDFAKWETLNVDGIKLDVQPDKLQVDRVKFTGLDTSVIVGPDKRINLQTILRDQIAAKTNSAASTNATAAPAEKKPVPNVAVGALVFENASFHFADQSIEPHCAFDVQEFGGTIQGLSSQEQTTANVDVKGKVDSHSPFVMSGKIHPLGGDLYADVSVAFTNTELTAFTPYTEKFAGRPLQKGKLSFAVHYLVQTNALKAENFFYVDQLTLGAKNDSTNATKLPVKLGIALLKDRHGRIQLDVPVAGRMNDPKFRLAPIIWQVVENLLIKAATSPFSLLGAMFGGGPGLDFVSFPPGQAMIPDFETNKLETLAKALYERPELTMEINGSVDPALDREPLAHLKLDQQIKSLWIKEQTDAGKPAVTMDEVQLDSTNHDRLLTQVYTNTFGAYQPLAPATNQSTASAAPPITPKPTKPARPDPFANGASRLFKPFVKETPVARPVSPTAGTATTNTSTATPPESELADMTARLLQKIEITDDDFRALMNQRAAKVQAYLLNSGKVGAERLFITAPKPIGGSLKGEDRVNLSLD